MLYLHEKYRKCLAHWGAQGLKDFYLHPFFSPPIPTLISKLLEGGSIGGDSKWIQWHLVVTLQEWYSKVLAKAREMKIKNWKENSGTKCREENDKTCAGIEILKIKIL